MERIRRTASLAIVAWTMAVGIALAAPADFYLNLLRRGIANVDSGQNDVAARELRIAAFGLVDSIPQFQTAHIYLAIASDRLKREPDARLSATRVVAAERVEPRYGSLAIPAETRRAFDAIAARLLTPEQLAILRRSATGGRAVEVVPPVPPPTVPPAIAVPTPDPPRAIVPDPPRRDPAPTPVPDPPRTTPRTPDPVPAPDPPRAVVPDPPRRDPAPTPPPAPTPARPTPRPPTTDNRQPTTAPRATFATAEAAVSRNDLPTARRIYGELLGQNLDRPSLLRVAEGLYRSRDFRGVVEAFDRIGTLRSGEEPYRYYLAVALYEVGRYGEAKRALAGALPHIEVTPDVARYRAKIEGAID